MSLAYKHLAQMPNGDTEIVGRGLRVYTVLGLKEAGDTPEVIADAYSLPLGAVYEALAYAADHPEEMEAIRQAELAVQREMLLHLPAELRRDIPLP
jgi:uncharacterized protein (DUF433 family)